MTSMTRTSTPDVSSTTHETPAPTPSSSAAAAPTPPFVATATWVGAKGGRSLRIVPTPAGRAASGVGDGAEAWAEVVRLHPDADSPGMRAQFECHWVYARLVAPDKPSWNIEPWRPVVTQEQLVQTRCNPGGAESAEETENP